MLLSVTAPVVRAEDAELNSEKEVLERIRQGRETEEESIQFTCSQALFDQLSADGWAELVRLQVMAGVSSHRIKQNASTRLVLLDGVKYTDTPWAECGTEKEARQAVARFVNRGAESFTLLCTPALAQKLSDGTLINILGLCGIQNARTSFYTSGVVEVSETKPFRLPWAAVYNAAEFNAAMESFAADQTEEFYLAVALDYYQELQEREGAWEVLHAGSMLDRYAYTGKTGILNYYGVTYTQEPTVLCYDREDVVEAIRRMGSLAGLHIRYQHGDSCGGFDVSLGDAITHMWNLLELDGSWRQVDVTWDDREGESPAYTWFDLGYDRASRNHRWNEDMTVPLLAETDRSARPDNELSVTDEESLQEAVEKAESAGWTEFFLVFDREGFADYESALERLSKSLQYSWNPYMRVLQVVKS